MFKTPEFWYQNKTPNLFLKLVAIFYDVFSKIYRSLQKNKKLSRPIICIGNITMGGSGKTPVAIAIAEILKDMGRLPHFLSRGYGGNLKDIVLVNPKIHNFLETGDEPLLLSKHFPCWIAKNRALGAIKAIDGGAGSVVMDDGFQNLSVYKDVSILVIDSNIGFGNGFVFPAGPLRETPENGLNRASALILLNTTNDTSKAWSDYFKEQGFDKPIFYADIVSSDTFTGQKVIGFAGLGLPEKLKITLEKCGADIIEFHKFADHHPYTAEEIKELLTKADEENAVLVTTGKDFVRIPLEFRDSIKTCSITLQWQDEQAIKAFLKEQLAL